MHFHYRQKVFIIFEEQLSSQTGSQTVYIQAALYENLTTYIPYVQEALASIGYHNTTQSYSNLATSWNAQNLTTIFRNVHLKKYIRFHPTMYPKVIYVQ